MQVLRNYICDDQKHVLDVIGPLGPGTVDI